MPILSTALQELGGWGEGHKSEP
jgi:hypothetical protein